MNQPSRDSELDPAHDAAASDAIARPLVKVRSAARRLLVTRETAWIVACMVAAVLAMGLVDYLLRMPMGIRAAYWLAGVTILIYDIRRRLLPALRFNPPISEVSLRLEHTVEGRRAGLEGVLTSGLELASAQDHASQPTLREQVVHNAGERLKLVAASKAVLSPAAARRALALAALALLPVAGLTAWQPEMSLIGLRRVLTPWTNATWPKRTEVADATRIAAHPLGSAVPLRAVVSRTPSGPGKTDVWATYRLVDGDRKSPPRRALLTGQGRSVSVSEEGAAADVRGELYERLVEPSGFATEADGAGPGPALALEYWFETDDDRTPAVQIALVEPPVILSASVEIAAPAYAGTSETFASGTHDLGNGRDERSSVGPVLAGSRMVLRLSLNKPVPAPRKPATVFPGAALPADADLQARGAAWSLSWTADQPLRLPVTLTDEHGITADRDAAFQFGVIADRAPAAAIVDPAQDESVLATAILTVAGEGRDDVGLAWSSVEMQLLQAPAASEGAPAEPSGAPTQVARTDAAPGEQPLRQVRVATDLDLSTLTLKPRDEVWLTALAKDTFESPAGAHEPVRSSPRRLRIIAESELIEQVRAELAGVRQAALRLDQDQGEITRRSEAVAPADLRPLQDGLTQRIQPQGEIVKRLADRVSRNNLVDRALTGLLNDSASALSEASKASASAEHSIEQADRAASDAAAREQLTKDASAAQKQVRDQLGRLISMLDRGQDGYTVRREVQRLIEEQKRLMEQTRELGDQTRGKRPDELPGPQKDQLSQASDQQQDLARRAAQMLSDMAQRSVTLERQDPALAQALAKSAQRGRQDQVPDRQQKASEQIRQNQTGSAEQSQEKAIESLEKMMEDLDQTERQRDEALKRVLEDAIASIQALIEAQEREITALDRAMPEARFAGLDAGMIRLHSDTLGVAEKIRGAFRELAAVADMIDGAARAQSAAISVLRADAPDGPEASQAERQSHERLRAAKAEAERLKREAEDKDQSRKREDLRKAYQEALEAQVALHGRTVPLVGKDLDRRQRAGVRGLGEQQVQIRTKLTVLRDQNAGIGEAKLFDYAHKRLDETTGRAAALLGEGQATSAVDRDQLATIRILQSLVEALKDPKKKDFRDSPGDEDGGDGNGNGGTPPLIQPIAQLRLLRLMQQEIADLTRAAGDDALAGKPDPVAIDEVAKMQTELSHRAKELLERPSGPDDKSDDKPANKPGDQPADPEPTANFGADQPPSQPAPSTPPPPAPQPPSEPPKDSPNPLPTLDDLLGLPKTPAPKPASDASPAGDAAREELERQLATREAEGAQADLLALMNRAAQRLEAQRDPGVATQRAQADAIKRLDQLIDQAERNQQQQQSKSSKPRPDKAKQQQQQMTQQSQKQNQPSPGDNRDFINPPGREDGSLKPAAPGAGARWGSLPEHVRDALTQGLSDRFSSLYRSMTEEYYRRLAEEPKASGSPR